RWLPCRATPSCDPVTSLLSMGGSHNVAARLMAGAYAFYAYRLFCHRFGLDAMGNESGPAPQRLGVASGPPENSWTPDREGISWQGNCAKACGPLAGDADAVPRLRCAFHDRPP